MENHVYLAHEKTCYASALFELNTVELLTIKAGEKDKWHRSKVDHIFHQSHKSPGCGDAKKLQVA